MLLRDLHFSIENTLSSHSIWKQHNTTMSGIVLYRKPPGITVAQMDAVQADVREVVKKCLGNSKGIEENERGDLILIPSKALDIIEQSVCPRFCPCLLHLCRILMAIQTLVTLCGLKTSSSRLREEPRKSDFLTILCLVS